MATDSKDTQDHNFKQAKFFSERQMELLLSKKHESYFKVS
jgi:hypothetical protein